MEAHTTIPAHQVETLARLTDAIWDPETSYPRLLLDSPKLTYRKRDFGGYFVEFEGLHIGWVVKIYGQTTWSAWTYDESEYPKKTRKAADGARTRVDAAETLAATVTKWDRRAFEDHLLAVEVDRARWEALMAR